MSEVDNKSKITHGEPIGDAGVELQKSLKSTEKASKAVVKKLEVVEVELQQLADDKEKYALLDEIGDRLETLNKLGGGYLLWGEDCTKEQSDKNFDRIQHIVGHYDELYTSKQTERDTLVNKLHSYDIEIALIHEEITLQEIFAEDRKHDFALEREPTLLPYRQMDMPWYHQGEEEKTFRKSILIAVVVTIVMGIAIPLITISKPDRGDVVEIPERLAKMLEKKKPPPPKPEKKPEESPTDRPEPTEKEKKVARKKAEKTGLAVFKDVFSDLMEIPADAKMGAEAKISNSGQTATRSNRSIITSSATSSSGGIRSSAHSRDVGGAGENIGAVKFSRIKSSIGTDFEAMDLPVAGNPLTRNDEDIQIVFDRYKASLYKVYNRALRSNPTLRGRMVLRITIRADGVVAKCTVDSSDMNAPALEAKIIAKIKGINFGKKEGGDTLTILYPIDFLPAS